MNDEPSAKAGIIESGRTHIDYVVSTKFEGESSMALYSITGSCASVVPITDFSSEAILERQELQPIVRDNIEMIDADLMVIAESFSNWESNREIDLLCLNREANLVVVELKRDRDAHMELQAIRYAAMVSTFTFENAVSAHFSYLRKTGDSEVTPEDTQSRILDFLGWEVPSDEEFAQDVLIVLLSRSFSNELLTSVLWLRDRDVDIRCFRAELYKLEDQVLSDVRQIVPLPEASDYQIAFREKQRAERKTRTQNRDFTRFDLTVGEKRIENLPKRKLVFSVVKFAIENGAAPLEVFDSSRTWIILDGEKEHEEFLREAQNPEKRLSGSSSQKLKRFFVGKDDLIVHQGRTYAFTKMWGEGATNEVDRIIRDLELSNVRYSAHEEDHE